MNKIMVLVPFRNVGEYLIDCVNSLLDQEYSSYEVFLLDDQSTDGTLDLIVEEFNHIHKIRNHRRMGPMENIYRALLDIPIDDEDIVLLLDGDDYIFGEYAFQLVNERYQGNNLLTYGQYITNYGTIGHCSAYTEEEFRDVRSASWKGSHLKTFKYKLFKALQEQDTEGKHFKLGDGSFFMASSDMGIMIPLMEVAGFENINFIPNVVYCYRQHQNNDHMSVSGRSLQIEAERCIRNRKTDLIGMF
ncbi:glycosyltransferase family 2 protein [Parapedobacter tibetensis]|uniref:glycosyltransferase family 2 protein n=1 Tax=Parapedobacter tibetensis TaxID=2972951 RepID=UPI00214D4624|nr:glycosyltransferase family 2 protein [Parapedobacter tibetensis]